MLVRTVSRVRVWPCCQCVWCLSVRVCVGVVLMCIRVHEGARTRLMRICLTRVFLAEIHNVYPPAIR